MDAQQYVPQEYAAAAGHQTLAATPPGNHDVLKYVIMAYNMY